MSELGGSLSGEPRGVGRVINRLVSNGYFSQPKDVYLPRRQVIIPTADWNYDRAFDVRVVPDGIEIGVYARYPQNSGKLAPFTIETAIQTGEDEVTPTEELYLFPLSGNPNSANDFQRVVIPFSDSSARIVKMKFPVKLLEGADIAGDPAMVGVLRKSRLGLAKSPGIEEGWRKFVQLNLGILPEEMIEAVQPQPVSRT